MSAAREPEHIHPADDHRHTYDDDHHHDDTLEHRAHHAEREERTTITSTGRTWSPAQLVAGAIGLLFVVLGGVTMLRTGFADVNATAFVGWYEHTLIFGIVELVLGLIFLAAAASTYGVRSSSISLGVLMIAFGLVAMIEPNAMSTWVGDAYVAGISYLVIGAIAVVAGWISPVLTTSGSRRVDTDTAS